MHSSSTFSIPGSRMTGGGGGAGEGGTCSINLEEVTAGVIIAGDCGGGVSGVNWNLKILSMA